MDKQVEQRAWELSGIIMIYCLDHRICKATGNAKRDHIKFPIMPKISKVRDLCKKKVKIIRKRKRSIGQCSTKSVSVQYRLSRKRNKHTQRAAEDNSFEHTILKPESPAMSLKQVPLIEPSTVGAAGLSMLELSKGQGKQFENSSAFVMGTRTPCSDVGRISEKRRTGRPSKQTSTRTLCNISKKCAAPSEGMFDHSFQQDILLKNPSLENEIKIHDNKYGNKKGKPSEHYSGKGAVTNEGTTCGHEEQSDVPRNKLFMYKHAEGNQSKPKSKRGFMVWGQNAGGCSSVSGKEGGICMRESQLSRRPYGQDSKSERTIARNDGTTSIIPGNVGVTPDHVDVTPEKQLIVQHVHRTTDKIDSHPDEVHNRGYAGQEEPKSSQYNVNSKATDRDFSGDQSCKIREFKRMVTNVNTTDLGKNSKCIEDEREAHHSDNSHQCLLNLKERDYMDRSYRNIGDNSLCYDYENKVAETSGCNAKQGTGSSRREDLTNNTKESSSNSPMGANAQKKPMNHSTEGQRSYSYLYDPHRGNNNQFRYEQQCHVNYSSNGNYDSKRWSNMRSGSALPPAGFNAGRWQGPFSYLREPEHGITGWQSSSFCPRSPGCFSGSWHSPPFYAGRPDHADYTTYQNNLSNVNHGGYHAMGTDPASRYSPCVNNNGGYQPHNDVSLQGHGVRYGARNFDYGVRSNYTFGWGPGTPARGSVTDRYAPCLEQTNYQPRGRPMF